MYERLKRFFILLDRNIQQTKPSGNISIGKAAL